MCLSVIYMQSYICENRIGLYNVLIQSHIWYMMCDMWYVWHIISSNVHMYILIYSKMLPVMIPSGIWHWRLTLQALELAGWKPRARGVKMEISQWQVGFDFLLLQRWDRVRHYTHIIYHKTCTSDIICVHLTPHMYILAMSIKRHLCTSSPICVHLTSSVYI